MQLHTANHHTCGHTESCPGISDTHIQVQYICISNPVYQNQPTNQPGMLRLEEICNSNESGLINLWSEAL